MRERVTSYWRGMDPASFFREVEGRKLTERRMSRKILSSHAILGNVPIKTVAAAPKGKYELFQMNRLFGSAFS